MNPIGQCYTASSLWKALEERGTGTHKVTILVNELGSIKYAKVERKSKMR